MIFRDRRSGLYAIVNVTNGHRYIGSTIDFYNRSREHRLWLRRGRHHCGHLQNAWNIYGEDAFAFRVLAVLEPSDLFDVESRLLAKIVDHDGCYNSGVDARAPMRGRKLSAQTRALMSAKGKGRKFSAEHRAKIGKAHKGRAWSEEQLMNVRSATKSVDRIAKIAAAHRGMKRSPEARTKMSAAAIGRKASESARRNMSEAQRGRKHSEATIEKLRAIRRAAWADPASAYRRCGDAG